MSNIVTSIFHIWCLHLRKGPQNMIKGTNSILGNESMNVVPKYG